VSLSQKSLGHSTHVARRASRSLTVATPKVSSRFTLGLSLRRVVDDRERQSRLKAKNQAVFPRKCRARPSRGSLRFRLW